MIGTEMLGLGSFQPDGTDTASAAALHMVAEKYRRDPHLTVDRLIQLDPLDPAWDNTTRRIERLSRRYP